MLLACSFAFGRGQGPHGDLSGDRAGSEVVAPTPLKTQLSAPPQGATERKEPVASTILPS